MRAMKLVAMSLVLIPVAGGGCALDAAAPEVRVEEEGFRPDRDYGSPDGKPWPGHEPPGDWSRRGEMTFDLSR